MDSIDFLWQRVNVVNNIAKVGGQDEIWDLVSKGGELVVNGLEGSLGLGREIKHQDWLVNLHRVGAGSLQPDEELLVPALKDVVLSVDLESKRIVVRDVPGLTTPG